MIFHFDYKRLPCCFLSIKDLQEMAWFLDQTALIQQLEYAIPLWHIVPNFSCCVYISPLLSCVNNKYTVYRTFPRSFVFTCGHLEICRHKFGGPAKLDSEGPYSYIELIFLFLWNMIWRQNWIWRDHPIIATKFVVSFLSGRWNSSFFESDSIQRWIFFPELGGF